MDKRTIACRYWDEHMTLAWVCRFSSPMQVIFEWSSCSGHVCAHSTPARRLTSSNVVFEMHRAFHYPPSAWFLPALIWKVTAQSHRLPCLTLLLDLKQLLYVWNSPLKDGLQEKRDGLLIAFRLVLIVLTFHFIIMVRTYAILAPELF